MSSVGEAILLPNGLINLGYSNPSAVARIANWAQMIINTGAPVPRSPFCVWAADRVTDKIDKQNLKILISGKTGSGKSYTALYLATRLAEEMARSMGDSPSDHFNLDKNCALLTDVDKVAKILATMGKYQVVLIDDAGVTANAKDFMKTASINLHKIVMTMRTKRGIVIFTSPLKKNIDLGIREIADITVHIYKPFHKGGFNLCKATSYDVSEYRKNVIYQRRLSFEGCKISFWVAFAPSEDLMVRYDALRDAAAQQLMEEAAGMRKTSKEIEEEREEEEYVSRSEIRAEQLVKRYGERLKSTLMKEPDISMNALATKYQLTLYNLRRVMVGVGLPYPEKKKKEPVP